MNDKPQHGDIRFEQEADHADQCYKIKATLFLDSRKVYLPHPALRNSQEKE